MLVWCSGAPVVVVAFACSCRAGPLQGRRCGAMSRRTEWVPDFQSRLAAADSLAAVQALEAELKAGGSSGAGSSTDGLPGKARPIAVASPWANMSGSVADIAGPPAWAGSGRDPWPPLSNPPVKVHGSAGTVPVVPPSQLTAGIAGSQPKLMAGTAGSQPKWAATGMQPP